MKTKLNTAIALLYIAGFSNFILELIGLEKELSSFLTLLLDLGICYVGFSSIGKSKFNISFMCVVVLLSLFNFLAHDYSIISYLNGLRELLMIFVMFSFYEGIANTPWAARFKLGIDKFIKTFLIAQFPIVIYQFIMYGASDKVGGSLGGGNSGVLTLLTIPMVFMLIKERRVKVGFKAYYNALYLIPIFMNETKISFLLIPIMFLCLTDFKKKMGTIFLSLGFGAVVFMALNTLYSDQGQTSSNPIKEMFNGEFLEFYLLSDVDEGVDVPRFTKIITAVNLLNENTTEWVLGKEVGAFKGGKVITLSTFAKNYDWLLLGSRPYSFYLLITGGWSLLLTMVAFVFLKIFKVRKQNYDKQFQYLLMFLFICILFYNDAFRNQFFAMTFSFFVLQSKGYFSRHIVIVKSAMNKIRRPERLMPAV